jgi:hypothetical protein
MAITINNAVRNGAADGVRALFAGGSIRVYDGTPPANASTALGSNVLLAEVTLASPAFGAAASGVITLSGVPRSDNSINASGTASFFRMLDSGGTTNILQGSVGVGSGDMQVDSVTFVLGGVFTINSMTVTMPAS